MIHCAVIGATGYTGLELVKILLRHPKAKITALTTRQKEAIPLHKLVPTVPADIDLVIRQHAFADIKKDADVVFLCLPHTEAMESAQKFRAAGKIVIDLSADFRLRDFASYEAWYKVKHKQKELLKEAVYGMPEIYREEIRSADLIANPGCYPTSAILALEPLIRKRLIDFDSIVIDSKSGISGAGKKLTPATQFCEIHENFYAYKVGCHQHTPEIEQTLTNVAAEQINVSFTTHLLPLERGILSSVYLKRSEETAPGLIREAFLESYAKEPFIRVKPEGQYPSLKDVKGTNFCDIGIWDDPESNRVIVLSAIDNLIKGASGQAVHNMNIRCGFEETEGLRTW